MRTLPVIKHTLKAQLKDLGQAQHTAPPGVDEQTAARLRDAMDTKGVGPSELARLCEVTPSAVTAWLKKGATGMRLGNLLCVSDALGVTVEWLARGGSQRQAAMQLTDAELRHIDDLRALLPQDREVTMAQTAARAKQMREHAQHILGLTHAEHVRSRRR
jgi:hypothetical protein